MDNEIYQLVKHLSQRGLDNLTSEEKLIKLWQRAVKKWNKSHEPTSLTLEEVYRAFKNRWPQIYGGEPLNGTLYLSFSYIDYYFTRNSKGQVCGGIWPRINQKPKFPLNMTAEQIVEMAFWMRDVPLKLSLMNKVEKELKNDLELVEELIGDWQSETTVYPTRVEMLKQIVKILKSVAMHQYSLGNFEASLDTLNRAMAYLQLSYSEDESNFNSILEVDIYEMMGYNLNYLMRNADFTVCYELAQYKQMRIYERKDWKKEMRNYLTEDEKTGSSQKQRSMYLNWACNRADAYLTNSNPGKAISILERAEAVARDMNEIEEGRWTENLESIKSKLATIRENANK